MGIEIALTVAVLLLIGNAFFVAAEFAIVSVRRSAIESEAARGSKRALGTLRALENVGFLMAGAQLGVTLCSVGLGAVAEPAVAHLLEAPFDALDISFPLLHPVSFVVALALTVFAHVVIGEMVPKNIALAEPGRAALVLTPILVWIVRLLNPIVHALNLIANLTLRLFKVDAAQEVSSAYTRDEMADLVKESRKEGYLTEDNEQLLSGALSFDTQTVQDVAKPIAEFITVSNDATYADVEALSTSSGFSRFPVTSKKGEMVGYVHIKDIIMAEDSYRDQKIQSKHIRKLAEVNTRQSIRMTLKIMQASGAHIALVMSGKTIHGVVTLEDLLEELVGEMSQRQFGTASN